VNHVLYGATLPLAVCAVIYALRGWRAGPVMLVVGPLAMLASGFVAIIPDLPRLWGDHVTYRAWHTRDWCNYAWGHCWVDARESIDSWAYYPVVFLAVGGLVLVVAWRELHLAERGR
jgi:hypothetical protein